MKKFGTITIASKVKKHLDKLRVNNELYADQVFSYSNVLEYLLIKAGHLEKIDSQYNYDYMSRLINEK